MEVICKICGKVMNLPPSGAKNRKFCSWKCRSKYRSLYESGPNSPLYKMIESKCKQCGKIFLTHNCRINNKEGIFCSRYCKHIWISKNIRGDRLYNYSGGPAEVKCLHCGNYFKTPKSRIKKGLGKFCGFKCYGAHLKGKMSGENNPSWNGGVTPRFKLIRRTEEYKTWRKEVFKRDRFICQKCGGKGKIEAHHIISFKKLVYPIMEKYPLLDIIEISKNIDKLWDISNGITLCVKCHKKEHYEKGR